MLTSDEETLLMNRNTHEAFSGFRSLARNYIASTKGCKPCGARRLPSVEQAFKSYVIAIKNNPLFQNLLIKLFGKRVPNIRGIQ